MILLAWPIIWKGREFLERIKSSPCSFFLFWHGCLIFEDKLNSFKKVFNIAKEREAQGVTITHSASILTPSPIGLGISDTVEVTLVSPGPSQHSSGVDAKIIKDYARSPPTNNKRIGTMIRVLPRREILLNGPDCLRVLLLGHPLLLKLPTILPSHITTVLMRHLLQYLKRVLLIFINFLKQRRLSSSQRTLSTLTILLLYFP